MYNNLGGSSSHHEDGKPYWIRSMGFKYKSDILPLILKPRKEKIWSTVSPAQTSAILSPTIAPKITAGIVNPDGGLQNLQIDDSLFSLDVVHPPPEPPASYTVGTHPCCYGWNRCSKCVVFFASITLLVELSNSCACVAVAHI